MLKVFMENNNVSLGSNLMQGLLRQAAIKNLTLLRTRESAIVTFDSDHCVLPTLCCCHHLFYLTCKREEILLLIDVSIKYLVTDFA